MAQKVGEHEPPASAPEGKRLPELAVHGDDCPAVMRPRAEAASLLSICRLARRQAPVLDDAVEHQDGHAGLHLRHPAGTPPERAVLEHDPLPPLQRPPFNVTAANKAYLLGTLEDAVLNDGGRPAHGAEALVDLLNRVLGQVCPFGADAPEAVFGVDAVSPRPDVRDSRSGRRRQRRGNKFADHGLDFQPCKFRAESLCLGLVFGKPFHICRIRLLPRRLRGNDGAERTG